jgi:hypothetical protein
MGRDEKASTENTPRSSTRTRRLDDDGVSAAATGIGEADMANLPLRGAQQQVEGDGEAFRRQRSSSRRTQQRRAFSASKE